MSLLIYGDRKTILTYLYERSSNARIALAVNKHVQLALPLFSHVFNHLVFRGVVRSDVRENGCFEGLRLVLDGSAKYHRRIFVELIIEGDERVE
jgi:hypothetical protein